MTLISENKPRIGPSNKTKLMVFGGLIVVTIIFSVVYNGMGVGRSPRVQEYLDKKKQPTTREDSARINLLYEKLASVYQLLNVTNYFVETVLAFT